MASSYTLADFLAAAGLAHLKHKFEQDAYSVEDFRNLTSSDITEICDDYGLYGKQRLGFEIAVGKLKEDTFASGGGYNPDVSQQGHGGEGTQYGGGGMQQRGGVMMKHGGANQSCVNHGMNKQDEAKSQAQICLAKGCTKQCFYDRQSNKSSEYCSRGCMKKPRKKLRQRMGCKKTKKKPDFQYKMAFDCEVCMDTYNVNDPDRVPKVMSCGHTFCGRCLGRLIVDGSIKCPKCRSVLPGIKTVDDVRNNFTLIEIMSPNERKDADAHPKCKEHNKGLILFCNVDETLVCHVCLTRRGSHAGHEFDDPIDVAAKYEVKLKEHIRSINSLLSNLNKLNNGITLRATALSKDCDRTKAKIQKSVDGIIEMLNARKDVLFEEVEHHLKAEAKVLEYEKSKIENSISGLTECRVKAQEVLKRKNDITAVNALLRIVPSIAVKLRDIPQHSRLNCLETDVNNIDVQFDDIAKSVRCYGEVTATNGREEDVCRQGHGGGGMQHGGGGGRGYQQTGYQQSRSTHGGSTGYGTVYQRVPQGGRTSGYQHSASSGSAMCKHCRKKPPFKAGQDFCGTTCRIRAKLLVGP